MASSQFDWESAEGHDRIRKIGACVRVADEKFEHEGGGTRHWVRDYFLPSLEAGGFTVAPKDPIEPALLDSAHAMARESDDGLIAAVEKLKEVAKLLGGGRINWEPNYPEVQQALRIALDVTARNTR